MGTQNTTTIDFGTTPVDTKTFTIVDAALSGLTYAEAWAMRDTTADNGITLHEMANTLMRFACSISGTTLTIVADILMGRVTGQFKIRYVAN